MGMETGTVVDGHRHSWAWVGTGTWGSGSGWVEDRYGVGTGTSGTVSAVGLPLDEAISGMGWRYQGHRQARSSTAMEGHCCATTPCLSPGGDSPKARCQVMSPGSTIPGEGPPGSDTCAYPRRRQHPHHPAGPASCVPVATRATHPAMSPAGMTAHLQNTSAPQPTAPHHPPCPSPPPVPLTTEGIDAATVIRGDGLEGLPTAAVTSIAP